MFRKEILLNHYINHTLVGIKILYQSDVVGASPVSAAPITSSFLKPGFNRLCKDNCKTRQGTFQFLNLVCLILEVWWQICTGIVIIIWYSWYMFWKSIWTQNKGGHSQKESPKKGSAYFNKRQVHFCEMLLLTKELAIFSNTHVNSQKRAYFTVGKLYLAAKRHWLNGHSTSGLNFIKSDQIFIKSWYIRWKKIQEKFMDK